jgi:hypothetical protein
MVEEHDNISLSDLKIRENYYIKNFECVNINGNKKSDVLSIHYKLYNLYDKTNNTIRNKTFFIIINNIDNSQNNTFIHWLNEHSNKWIIKLKDNELLCIFSTNDYSNLSHVSASIHNYYSKKYNFIGVIKDLLKIKRSITNNKLFFKYFNTFCLDNQNDEDIYKNLILKNFTKKYINNIIEINTVENDENDENEKKKNEQNIICKTCRTCNKNYTNITTYNRHIKYYCSKKTHTVKDTKINNQRDALNFYCKETIDINTFIKNFESTDKYQLTKAETTELLKIYDSEGIKGYAEKLVDYLQKKYTSLFKDLNGNTEYIQNVLPFVSSDVKVRTHYEKTDDDWVLVKSLSKIQKILNISDKQIYDHHQKPIYYNKKGKTPVCNILLRKSDYLTIEANYKNIMKQQKMKNKNKN